MTASKKLSIRFWRESVNRGWIKIYRAEIESPIFANADLFRLYCLCLSRAAHKPTQVWIEKTLIPLEVDQFITGRFDLHGLWHQWRRGYERRSPKPYTVWRWLQKLEEVQKVSIKTSNKCSIITVTSRQFSAENVQQMCNSGAQRRIKENLETKIVHLLPSANKPQVVDTCTPKAPKKKPDHWPRLWKACDRVESIFPEVRWFARNTRSKGFLIDEIIPVLEALAVESPTPPRPYLWCYSEVRRTKRRAVAGK